MDSYIRRHLMGRGVSSEVENPRDAAWNRARQKDADAHARYNARRNLEAGVIDESPPADPQLVSANRLRAWAFGDDYASRYHGVRLTRTETIQIQRLALKIKLLGGQPIEI